MFDSEICISRLISLRKEKKLSQEQIGNIINVSKQAINEIEKGRNKISLEKACILADYYGVTLDSLAGRTDNNIIANSNKDSLSKEEESIIKNFRLLDDISKGKLIERSRILLEESVSDNQKSIKKNA